MVNLRRRGTAPQPAKQNQDMGDGWYDQGSEGFQKSERIAASRKKKGPLRFWMKQDEEKQIVLLDDTPGFFIYEYEIWDSHARSMSYETAMVDHGHDPLSQLVGKEGSNVKEPYYAMYLTCIDLTPYTTKEGREIPFSKKLLPVKSVQQKRFKKYLEQYGTFRGMILNMSRLDKKEARIGTPEFQMADPQNGQVLLSEEDIIENFGHAAVTGQDGRVIKQENEDCYPFNYVEVLKPTPPEDLARQYGVPYNPGSAAANAAILNEEEAAPRTAPAPTARPAGLKTGEAKPATQSQSAVEQGDDTAPPPRRQLVKKPAEAPVQEEVDEDDIPPFDVEEDGYYEDE